MWYNGTNIATYIHTNNIGRCALQNYIGTLYVESDAFIIFMKWQPNTINTNLLYIYLRAGDLLTVWQSAWPPQLVPYLITIEHQNLSAEEIAQGLHWLSLPCASWTTGISPQTQQHTWTWNSIISHTHWRALCGGQHAANLYRMFTKRACDMAINHYSTTNKSEHTLCVHYS